MVDLTPCELRAVQAIRYGASNKVAAHRSGMAEQTLKLHLMAAIKKLHLQNRTQLALWANGVRIPGTEAPATPTYAEEFPA